MYSHGRLPAWAGRWRANKVLSFGLLVLMLLTGGIFPTTSFAATVTGPQPGTVRAWGDNRSDQIGSAFNGTQRAAPGSVAAASDYNITAVAAGRYYSLALRADGKVLAWGSNFPSGQLGIGTNIDSADPTAIPGIVDATLIAAGNSHGLASNGATVYAWGDDTFGQLGYTTNATCGGFPCSRSAQPIPNLGNVRGLAAGLTHSMAILGDGSVWTWGSNGRGQLGAGEQPGGPNPVKVIGVLGNGYLTDIVAVAAGEGHSMALKADGTVFAWGQNDQGQLGIGSASTGLYAMPSPVMGLTNIVAIKAGYRHSMALRADGVVFAWGFNSAGQLGNGTIGANTPCGCNPTPTAVPGLIDVAAIGAGHEHSLAVMNDGTVRAWGQNGTYQVGVEQPMNIAAPTPVPGLQKVFAVAAGSGHSVALALPTYCDVATNSLYSEAITQLAARGIIRGYTNGCFGPNDSTQRAQMAALIARAVEWDTEDHGNPFADQNGINADLWRNVGTLAHYKVALGYDGVNFGPTDKVTQAQTISFITRAMVKKGLWVQHQDNPGLYPNLPASSGHRADLATYNYYVPELLPGTAEFSGDWADWAQPASRGWFAEVLWWALTAEIPGQ